MDYEKFMKILDKYKHLYVSAKDEIEKYNIQREYDAISKIIEHRKPEPISKYKMGRYKILQYILECVKHDPSNGDWFNDENIKVLKEAGKLLYEFDKMDGMNDGLVWSFIPRRYHSDINYAWNGIGEWRS